MHKKLYLASQSVQRGRLLKEAGLDFEVIKQDADETSCDWGMPLQKLVEHLARLKMSCIQISPAHSVNEVCWVITADSLCVDKKGDIFGKPIDHEGAIRMVKSVRNGALAGTAFCIDRYRWDGTEWSLDVQYCGYDQAECILDVPDYLIEWYFKKLKELSGLDYMRLAGAFSITGFGAQFLKRVDGSYTAILGMPMSELRIGLEKLGYFD